MTPSRALCLAGCLLSLAGCGDDSAAAGPGDVRVVTSMWGGGDPGTTQQLLAAQLAGAAPRITAVFAHDQAAGDGAAAAIVVAQRSDVPIVSGGTTATVARQQVSGGQRAAVCVPAAAPAAAIEVALLACSGIAVPKELGLGVAWFTAANLAAGGTHEIAPGDLVLATQRQQHAATLSSTPATDVVFRIGLVDGGDAAPGGQALRDELTAAAAKYPQLQLLVGEPRADTAQQQATAGRFVAANVNVLLVVSTAPGALADVCAEASAQRIAVVVLGVPTGGDTHVCRLGADAGALGRAGAAALRQLLPRGGAVAELQAGDPASIDACHDALVGALARRR